MDIRIIYPSETGGVVVLIPAPNNGMTIEQIIAKDVPPGVPFKVVDVSEIPTERTFREAWEFQP